MAPLLLLPLAARAADLQPSLDFLTCDGQELWTGFREALLRVFVADGDDEEASLAAVGGRGTPAWLRASVADSGARRSRWLGCRAGVEEVAKALSKAIDVFLRSPGHMAAFRLRPSPKCGYEEGGAKISDARAEEPDFCFAGYVSASCCFARLTEERLRGECSDAHAAAIDVVLQDLTDKVGMPVGETITQTFGELKDLVLMPQIPALLMDSAPWPFRFADLVELVAQAPGAAGGDPGSWMPPGRGMLSRFAGYGAAPQGREPRTWRVNVWSVGLHATLAMEPESVWLEVISALGPWEISVEAVLAHGYCDVSGRNRCTSDGELAELLRRHVVPNAVAENDINKFPHVPDPYGLGSELLEIAGPAGADRADVVMCSEPPFFCLLLSALGKPTFGYFGNPFGAYLKQEPQEGFYTAFHDNMAVGGRNSFAVVSPYLSALVYWHTGVEVPVVHPVGLYTQATYAPASGDILVTKTVFTLWQMPCVLNRFVTALASEGLALTYRGAPVRFVDIRVLDDMSWANWARHKAAVILPYDPQQMMFYELYGMGVPLLVPDTELLPLFVRYGFTNLREFEVRRPGWEPPGDVLPLAWSERASHAELRWWVSLTDYDRSPHLLRWSSVPGLLSVLVGADLNAISRLMRREVRARMLWSADFWRMAFLRAVS